MIKSDKTKTYERQRKIILVHKTSFWRMEEGLELIIMEAKILKRKT